MLHSEHLQMSLIFWQDDQSEEFLFPDGCPTENVVIQIINANKEYIGLLAEKASQPNQGKENYVPISHFKFVRDNQIRNSYSNQANG